jgi:hypothetical protein
MLLEPSKPLSLSELRERLKLFLHNTRKVGIPAKLICPICKEEITDSSELHEVFFTRGDVQKADEDVQMSIFCPFNCVELHPRCHQEKATTRAGQIMCAQYIISMEGFLNIRRWMLQLELSQSAILAGAALLNDGLILINVNTEKIARVSR